jgi:hypothetical protein
VKPRKHSAGVVWGRACPSGADFQQASKYMLTVKLPSQVSISNTAERKKRKDTRPQMVRVFECELQNDCTASDTTV